ncbi:MAG: DUF6056 family protein [Pseudoflavonifractor sp.]|nr:DUF6056 family protein [Pseudoflavonifractor sp.]
MRPKHTTSRHFTYLTPSLLLIIGVLYAAYFQYIPFVGDDLNYYGSFMKYYDGIVDFPLHTARNMLYVNGRMSDKLNILWLCYLPRPMLSAITGAMIAVLMAIAIKASRLPRQWVTARVSLTALLVFTLPWWDSLSLFVCQFNYVWTATFVLAVIGIILNGDFNHRSMWLMLPAAFLVAAMHEACGLAASAGLVVYFWLNPSARPSTRAGRWSVIMFFLGALMPLMSPSFWSRVGSAGTDPNDPMWLLVIKSDFYALTLVLVIIFMAVATPRRLAAMMRSSWAVYAVAAIVSMAISAVSGIVGRSGWFAQVFALIALFRLAVKSGFRIPAWLGAVTSTLLSVAIVVHLIEAVSYQRVTGTQLQDCIDRYAADPASPVYMDFLGDPQQPWWLLHKTRGVPDADDTYIIETITNLHGDSIHPLTVLPTAVMSLSADSITSPVEVTPAYAARHTLLADTIPPAYISPTIPAGTDSRMLCRLNSTIYVVVPFARNSRTLYYLTPRDLDPGDR